MDDTSTKQRNRTVLRTLACPLVLGIKVRENQRETIINHNISIFFFLSFYVILIAKHLVKRGKVNEISKNYLCNHKCSSDLGDTSLLDSDWKIVFNSLISNMTSSTYICTKHYLKGPRDDEKKLNDWKVYLPTPFVAKFVVNGLELWDNFLESWTHGWVLIPTLFNQPGKPKSTLIRSAVITTMQWWLCNHKKFKTTLWKIKKLIHSKPVHCWIFEIAQECLSSFRKG